MKFRTGTDLLGALREPRDRKRMCWELSVSPGSGDGLSASPQAAKSPADSKTHAHTPHKAEHKTNETRSAKTDEANPNRTRDPTTQTHEPAKTPKPQSRTQATEPRRSCLKAPTSKVKASTAAPEHDQRAMNAL